jgi:hypothetical protein
LLNKDRDPFLSDWELDLTARKGKGTASQAQHEPTIINRTKGFRIYPSKFQFCRYTRGRKGKPLAARIEVDFNDLSLRWVWPIIGVAWELFAKTKDQRFRPLAR